MIRKILVVFAGLMLLVGGLMAQVPQKIGYQAVVRNEHGRLVARQAVGVKFSITSQSGIVVFSETQSATTDAHGLFSCEIGSVNSLVGIDWDAGSHFLKVDVDPEGRSNYSMHTTQQLISVPFALYAAVADELLGVDLRERQVLSIHEDTIFLTGGSYVKLPQIFDGDYRHLTNLPTSNAVFNNDAGYLTQEVQRLTISNDTLFLTGGSWVKIPAGFNGNYNNLTNKPNIPTQIGSLTNDVGFITNEVQILTISNDTVFLTGGSYVKLPHRPEVQTLADVAAINDSAFTQLKDVMDPTDLQDAVTKYYLDSIFALWNSDTVDRSTHNVTTINACDSYTWYGNTYSIPGTYTHAYSNLGGYYSVDTLHLTIRVGTYNVENVTAIGSYVWHDALYSATDTYLYHYNNLYGCPSVDTLHLTINTLTGASCTAYRMPGDTATLNVCNRYVWYGNDIRSSGVYEHNLGLIGHSGCDSVVRVNVQIRQGFQQDTAVRGVDSVFWRGQWYMTQGDYSHTYTAANGCDSVYTLHFMVGGTAGIGAAPGLYSVGPTQQVRFASGNLQYQSSNNYWQFAKHQYDMLHIKCEAPYYPSWADLFGWGTSGYHDINDSLNKNHRPWSTDNTSAPQGSFTYNNNQYGYGPSHFMADTSLVGASANYDWGMYNPIINGGNGAALWQLLSQEQWDYLLNQRPNASQLKSFAQIYGVPSASGSAITVCGYMVLADGWVPPAGITFVPNTNCESNSFSLTEWDSIEAHGALFLPMYGDPWNATATYWTQTSGGAGGAYALNMSDGTCILAPYNRSNPYSVRLAQYYQPGVHECNCTYYDTNIISNGTYSWHGYSYSESGDYMEAIVNNAGCDSIITLSLMIHGSGELNGLFSIDENRLVKFSQGNLQYKPSAGVWRFGNRQYDYVGAQNKYYAPSYTGWLDLFSWGVSGYHDPTDVFNLNTDPAVSVGSAENYGPSINMSDWNLTNTNREYDWGVHNPIANGGNVAGQWRTLTKEEWKYLVRERPRADDLVGFATINGVRGLVILPDNWTLPSGVTFFPWQEWNSSYEDNVYDTIRWPIMEAAGAVFLPASGFRENGSVNDPTYLGSYWTVTSSTYDDYWGSPEEVSDLSHVWTNRAWNMTFYLLPRGGKKFPNVYDAGWDGWVNCGYKHLAYSVRLVKDF